MPIPHPLIREIGNRAISAVSLDLDLIANRNRDDSYGRYCSIDGKALITLAVLQAFIEQGAPMDSDRLRNSYHWLLRNSSSCSSVEPALLRVNAAIATGEQKYEELQADLSVLRELIRDYGVKYPETEHIPGFLLAIECLHNFDGIDNQLTSDIKYKLTNLLKKQRLSPAELAYLSQIGLQCEFIDSAKIRQALNDILEQYQRGLKLWRSCLAETAYVIIDLSYISQHIDIPQSLKEVLISSSDELIKAAQENRPLKRSHNFPDEIGDRNYDRNIYLKALILRAISRSSIFFSEPEIFSLKFCAEYLRKIYEEFDQKRKVISIGFPLATLTGLICGGAIATGFIKGWTPIVQLISFISGCITIGSCVWGVSKRKK